MLEVRKGVFCRGGGGGGGCCILSKRRRGESETAFRFRSGNWLIFPGYLAIRTLGILGYLIF